MANIAIESWTAPTRQGSGLAGRLRALARYIRIRRGRRRALRLVRAESLDARMLEDVGIDPYFARHYEWLRELARAMGGGRF